MKKYLAISAPILLLALALSSCLAESKKERSIESINTDVESEQQTTLKEERIRKIFYTLPSPLELTMMFRKEGVQYYEDILHSTSKRETYHTILSKALNLGIYGADLSYSGLFGRHEAAFQYFVSSKVLAEELGIGTTFQEEFVLRLETNAGNKDTLLKVISEFFLKNDEYLRANDRQDISSYVLAAGWVEGMYLGTKIVDSEANASGVRNILNNQREPLHNIIVLFQNTNPSENSKQLLAMLGEAEGLYADVQGEMTEAQFNKVKDQIEKIRTFIVTM